jgi:hypothetical protein
VSVAKHPDVCSAHEMSLMSRISRRERRRDLERDQDRTNGKENGKKGDKLELQREWY